VIVSCPRCATRYRLPPRSKLASDATYRCSRCQLVFQTEAAAEEPRVLEADEEVAEEERFAFDEDEEEPSPSDSEPPAEPVTRAEPIVSTPARFAVRALLLVAAGYAVLSIYLYTHPDAARSLLGGVPVIGSRLVESALDPASVQLTDVRGDYLRVQGDQLVFVISGVAINNSPIAVRGVQVEGRIVGTRELRQLVFCGTAPRDVQDLSVREITLLQTLEPPRDWTLGAGEQTSFVVIFVSPPTDLRELSAEVVAVQGKRRRSSAPGAEGSAPSS
jgi:predicted Zn finger-like uncharacterized protein